MKHLNSEPAVRPNLGKQIALEQRQQPNCLCKRILRIQSDFDNAESYIDVRYLTRKRNPDQLE